ncbi:MAG: hypothetical protein AAF567_24480 [Actinomycetota bacterium]
MSLGPAEIAVIRRHVGDHPELSELEDINDRTGDPLKTALEILEIRYANMEADAAKNALADGPSEDWTANLKSLAGRVAQLRADIAAADAATQTDTSNVAYVTGHITVR